MQGLSISSVLVAALLVALSASADAQSHEALRTVGAVRALTLEEAGKHLPVQLRGVIIYCDQREARAFLQDESGAIFFRPPPPRAGEPELAGGELVEITGVTWCGRFSPSVAGDPNDPALAPVRETVRPVRLARLGPGDWPEPQLADLERIKTGEFHNRFVKLRATIQRVGMQHNPDWSGLRVELTTRAGLIVALVRRAPGDESVPADWRGVEAEVQAVVAGTGDEFGQFSDPWLALDSLSQIKPDFAATERALTQPARNIRELFRYAPPGQTPGNERVHVAGTVTLVRPGYGYFLGSAEGGIWVEALHFPEIKVGDVIDVAAYPARREHQNFLQDEISRVRVHNAPLPPRLATPEDAAAGRLPATLIAVDGQLLDQVNAPGSRIFFLEAAGRAFSARLDLAPDAEAPSKIEPGSWVRVTGICEDGAAYLPVNAPREAFSLLLREPGDVAVLRTPPWLNQRRLAWMLGTVAAGLGVCAAWVALLRQEVRRQTRTIAREVAQRTTVEERQRIARELHDTLEQELAGVNLHLDAAVDRLAELPPPLAGVITRARAMLQHSRAEARRSILDLRSMTLEQLGLAGSLREFAASFPAHEPPAVTFEVKGNARPLPKHVEFHLLRMAQEAAANAVKHARANYVLLTLDFGPDEVRLSIADDGAGFDPATADASRFGLRGMRERAAKISVPFALSSAPGSGTTITVICSAACAAAASGLHLKPL